MSLPLFVSYVGHRAGVSSRGWVVMDYPLSLSTPEAMTALVQALETARNYDAGTLVLVNFRRLEKEK